MALAARNVRAACPTSITSILPTLRDDSHKSLTAARSERSPRRAQADTDQGRVPWAVPADAVEIPVFVDGRHEVGAEDGVAPHFPTGAVWQQIQQCPAGAVTLGNIHLVPDDQR